MGIFGTMAKKLAKKASIIWLPRKDKSDDNPDTCPPGCILETGKSHKRKEVDSCMCPDRIRPQTKDEAQISRKQCGCILDHCQGASSSEDDFLPYCGCCVNISGMSEDADGQGWSSMECSDPAPDKKYRTLTPEEHTAVLRGIGAQDPKCEDKVLHPKKAFWPPKGMPRGLYRDVLTKKSKYMYLYYGMTALQWAGVITQIVLGTILAMKTKSTLKVSNTKPNWVTAWDYQPNQQAGNGTGSSTDEHGKIGGLIAANTINAAIMGVLASMSLIPRFNKIMREFSRVENDIRRVVDTGVVHEKLEDADEVIYHLYAEYQKAHCKVSMMPAPIPVHKPEKED